MDDLASGITDHYAGGRDPLATILGEFDAAGIDELSIETLAGVDEFHLGGRAATDHVIELLDLRDGLRVLDVGCGIGGPARTIAARTGATVLGVDLTPSFVETARELTRRVGLDAKVSFEIGDVRSLGVDSSTPGTFDAATMLHVGMNVPDKATLFRSVAAALQPGGCFVVYDVMRRADAGWSYPLPWATSPDLCFVESSDHYRDALEAAGFTVEARSELRDLVLSVIERAAASPPPVNLTHLVGPEFATMFANLITAIEQGALTPTAFIARTPR